jgi:uncharacterized protein YciW
MPEKAGNDVVAKQAGLVPGSAAHEALLARAEIMAMTQATHDAALSPRDPGGLSHAERAALAARIARLNADEELAAHYDGLMRAASASAETARIAEPDFKGDDRRVRALIAYTDLASASPRDATGADIEALKQAGIGDADIVRLAELNAFLAYQVRLVAGLKLMKGQA